MYAALVELSVCDVLARNMAAVDATISTTSAATALLKFFCSSYRPQV